MRVFSVDVAMALAERLDETDIEEFIMKPIEEWTGTIKYWYLMWIQN